MVLHLAPKKSYHPARKENIERVKRDEAEAQRQQELEEQASLQADAEARLALLRRHTTERAAETSKATLNPPKKRKRLDTGEAELEKQLGQKGWRVSKAAEEELEETSRAVIVRPEAEASIESAGHINFWADMEKGQMVAQTGNAEYLADKKKELDKWEDQITMYLGRPAKELRPWYGERDLKNGEERKRTEDQQLERAYKDEELKRMTDPLSEMSAYLKQRDDAKLAAEKARLDPWASTPARLATPKPSLLRPRTKRGEEPAYKRHIKANLDKDSIEDDYGPARPRVAASTEVPSAKPSLASDAQSRESSERARVQALKEAAKRQRLLSQTPATENGYSDQYNKRETRDAHKSWKYQRWEDEVPRERERERSRDTGRARSRRYS